MPYISEIIVPLDHCDTIPRDTQVYYENSIGIFKNITCNTNSTALHHVPPLFFFHEHVLKEITN